MFAGPSALDWNREGIENVLSLIRTFVARPNESIAPLKFTSLQKYPTNSLEKAL
jgi:hypothetical protein